MATIMLDDRKIDLDWLTPELIKKAKQESEGHATRIVFLQESARCWRFYNATGHSYILGENWKDTPSDIVGVPPSFENRIFKNANDLLGYSLKNIPIVRHYPKSEKPELSDLADQRDEMLASRWRPDGGNMGNVSQSVWQEAIISGLGVCKIYYDWSNQVMGDGEVAGDKIAHDDLFLDPYATNNKRGLDCRYIIHRTLHPKEYVRQRYGSEGEISLGERQASGRKKNAIHRQWSRLAGYVLNSFKDDKEDSYEDRVEVYEAWLFPTTTHDWNLVSDESEEDGETSMQVPEEKDFPYGLVATLINDTIVSVRANPNATRREMQVEPTEEDLRLGIMQRGNDTKMLGSKRHPFSFFYWQPGADNSGNNRIYCTRGAVANMIPPQVAFNSLSTNIHINAMTFANPQMIVTKGGIERPIPEKMTYEPGGVIVENPAFAGRGIRPLPGVPMPNYVLEMRNSKMNSIGDLAGANQLISGMGTAPNQMGTSHTTTGTIGLLQEAGSTPLVIPIQELCRGILDMAILIEGLMQQHYEVGRFIDVSNKGQQRFLEWKDTDTSAEFNLAVVSGSTTPLEDIGREQKVMEITSVVNTALQVSDPYLIMSTILYLKNLNRAYANDWIQLLQKKLAEVQQAQEMMQQIGAAEMGQQADQSAQNQGQMPQQEGLSEEGDLEAMLGDLRREIGME